MNIQTQIALRIKDLRKEKKIKQGNLAVASGIHRSHFNHIENGRSNVSVDTLLKITNGLGITIQEFFNTEMFVTGKYFNTK
jgi:transcriptional regulator with XRE-family HTH domain